MVSNYIRYSVVLLMLVTMAQSALTEAQSITYGDQGMYGFPMSVGLPNNPYGMAIPGQGYSYSSTGVDIPSGVGARYGFVASESSTGGYCGPYFGGYPLSVQFGFPGATHDFQNTAYQKDMAYEANVDNAFIGFPGIGAGTQGLGFPVIQSNKAQLKYAESVKFQFTTESDRINFAGYGFPMGMGLGYTSGAVVGGAAGYTGLGSPSYYPVA